MQTILPENFGPSYKILRISEKGSEKYQSLKTPIPTCLEMNVQIYILLFHEPHELLIETCIAIL